MADSEKRRLSRSSKKNKQYLNQKTSKPPVGQKNKTVKNKLKQFESLRK
tara:strand:- start:2311 stop:2457 length:147 start_codon:yes stop_codon:yes gene_type:complete